MKHLSATLLALLAVSPLVARADGPAPGARPNIVVFFSDDQGYGDLGCYGSKDLQTPNIDRMAAEGVRFTSWYSAAPVCSPSRAALLTGRSPQGAGVPGNVSSYPGKPGMPPEQVTIAERLRPLGYATAAVGKWHLGSAPGATPNDQGFGRFFGFFAGCVDNFSHTFYWDAPHFHDLRRDDREVYEDGTYLADIVTREALRFVDENRDGPFFLYVAHCAPHWPLHARPEDVARYRATYRDGRHALRASRYRRQVAMGLIDPATHPLPDLDGRGPDWDALDPAGREHQAALMAVHAAMVDRVDQGVGSILQALKETGREQDTIILVLADNGASPERYLERGFDRASRTREGKPIRYEAPFEPGSEETWGYIGSWWANAANTPFRYWKAESFEGGCHTPLIVHWPKGLQAARGSTADRLGHVIDVMPTCLELAGVDYPARYDGHALKPLEGESLTPTLAGRPRQDRRTLYFEHEGGRAVIDDGWKAVAQARGNWQLYHVAEDATETRDRAADEPERLAELTAAWRSWASRVGAPLPARYGQP
ncbi:hypothetical protein HK102_008955 [Quaeritorhiza haematococci]|nr:hypothetical protein HK102_008955 [Quaeritorhiza haematococci]